MDYFFYNTDARAFSEEPRPRFPVLIEGGFAAVGGDREKSGEQLGQLAPADLLLMYENSVGSLPSGACGSGGMARHTPTRGTTSLRN